MSVYTPAGVNQYKHRVERFLRENTEHLSVHKLRHNKPLTSHDLEALEQLLDKAGGEGAPALEEAFGESAKSLGALIRSIVGLERSAVQEAFVEFLDGGRFRADQIRFVQQIIDNLTRDGSMNPILLSKAPFTDIHPDGVMGLFPMEDAERVVTLIRGFNNNISISKNS